MFILSAIVLLFFMKYNLVNPSLTGGVLSNFVQNFFLSFTFYSFLFANCISRIYVFPFFEDQKNTWFQKREDCLTQNVVYDRGNKIRFFLSVKSKRIFKNKQFMSTNYYRRLKGCLSKKRAGEK